MPELPELEVLRRDLEKEVVGRRIKSVDVRGKNAMKVIKRHGRRKELQDMLVGGKVERVGRIRAALALHLDNGNSLMFELGEAGLLLKTSASETLANNTHIIISFTIGGQLRMIDASKAGEVYAIPTEEAEATGGASPIDPLEHQVTWHHFSALLAERQDPMKDLLLNPDVIAGLGDLYSDEILWTSGIRYDRRSNKLSSQDVRRIYRALMEVLQEAVKARGTTWGTHDFRDLHGHPGQFQLELKAFEREGEACRRCRSGIVKERYKGRFTYLCPQCQS